MADTDLPTDPVRDLPEHVGPQIIAIVEGVPVYDDEGISHDDLLDQYLRGVIVSTDDGRLQLEDGSVVGGARDAADPPAGA